MDAALPGTGRRFARLMAKREVNMPEIPIREAFSSRQDAEAARDRLEYGGFARSPYNFSG